MTAPTDAVLAELRTRADENQRAGFGNVTVDCEAVLALLDALAAAREAVVEYGSHHPLCAVDDATRPGAACNCGLAAHLPQARAAEEG